MQEEERMRIAMIGAKRIPSNAGGVEKTVEMQAVYLKQLGYEITVYNRGHVHSSKKEYRGIHLVDISIPKGSAGVPVYSFLATVHALLHHADVIVYHASGPCNMIRLTHFFRKPCVGIIHGYDSQREKWGRFASWYLKAGEKTALCMADRCFVLSQNMQEYAEKTYGRRPDLLYNGIDMPVQTDDDTALNTWHLSKDEYLLTAVRIVPEKGLHTLIQAFRACTTAKKLVIAGGADPRCTGYYQELRKLAGSDARIIFAGHQPAEKLSTLYDNCYLFVLPSMLEGMSNALLEAMAHGCCVLVSDIAENAEVINGHGMSFHVQNREDLQAKLQKLLDEPETVKQYRTGTKEYVTGKYRWQETAAVLDRCFKEITHEE